MTPEIRVDRSGIGAPPWVGAFSTLLDVGLLLLDDKKALQYASPRACALLGYRDADELAENWQSILEHVASAASAGSGPVDVFVSAGEPGAERSLRCEVHPIDEEGCAGTLLLIQSRERAEAVDAALRFSTRYRTLSALYATAAHDIKGSLNSLTLNLELVRQTAAPSPSQEVALPRALGALQREMDRLGRMVTAILEQGRGESADVTILDLKSIAGSVAELLGPRAERQRVTVELRAPESPVEVHGRADWVHQAILNLAHNALEAMPDGGVLRIFVEDDVSHAVVIVADTGPGVPREALPRIFDLHFTTKAGGHGLGLYVARRAARAHRGDVTVSSTDSGAEFHLRLPRDPNIS